MLVVHLDGRRDGEKLCEFGRIGLVEERHQPVGWEPRQDEAQGNEPIDECELVRGHLAHGHKTTDKHAVVAKLHYQQANAVEQQIKHHCGFAR